MKARITSLRDQVQRAAQAAVVETADRLARTAAGFTPVRTGRLRAAWEVVPSADKIGPEQRPGDGDQDGSPGSPLDGEGSSDRLARWVVNLTTYALPV
ncbi:MAG: HK97 gp10 family phage protein, partial [Deltaproteobacteria bacterium]|nr:HK97 gp10 family phage protein [Deltaproteobacteria bacterium]